MAMAIFFLSDSKENDNETNPEDTKHACSGKLLLSPEYKQKYQSYQAPI